MKTRKCTTIETLRRRAEGGPLIPQSVHGLVRFMIIASNIKGFRYGVHDQILNCNIRLTDAGRDLVDKFNESIGLNPMQLYSVCDAAALLEKSMPFWLAGSES